MSEVMDSGGGGAASEAKREVDFDAFVIISSGRLLRTAYLLTGDHGRAEDMVQEAFAKAFLRWNRIRADDPGAYVRRCLLNGYTDWWRRKPWREQPAARLPDRVHDFDHAEHHATQQALLLALDGLTRRERAVVVLRFYQDLSEAQIASALQIAPGTVKSTNARALGKLRNSAHLQDPDHEDLTLTKGAP
jgi:RNA polymerase sigma-70 factor (sigma-E family)